MYVLNLFSRILICFSKYTPIYFHYWQKSLVITCRWLNRQRWDLWFQSRVKQDRSIISQNRIISLNLSTWAWQWSQFSSLLSISTLQCSLPFSISTLECSPPFAEGKASLCFSKQATKGLSIFLASRSLLPPITNLFCLDLGSLWNCRFGFWLKHSARLNPVKPSPRSISSEVLPWLNQPDDSGFASVISRKTWYLSYGSHCKYLNPIQHT